MKIVLFYHSLISDWNHGNAHFLRGCVRELRARGHKVEVYEPRDSWSLANLLADHGEEPVWQFHRAYPGLRTNRYVPDELDLDHVLDGADLVLAHEWNEPALIAALGRHRAEGGKYRLLFHDTHHRSVTAPEEIERYDLREYDGVLAYGEAIAERYRQNGWASNVWVWHEAADVRLFHPLSAIEKVRDLVWVGNWGDDERSSELREFLIRPAARLQLRCDVWGVRYPDEAVLELEAAGMAHHGWIANFEVPKIFASARFTIHVPRRAYATELTGIPTIRMFEALACGIPLISAPWTDSEGLFVAGRDYLVAHDSSEMRKHMSVLINEPAAGMELAMSGLERIRARHTCAHRIDELLAIHRALQPARQLTIAPARPAAAVEERVR